MLQEAEQEEPPEDETQEGSSSAGSQKLEREPKLRHRRFFTDSERSALRSAYVDNPYPSRCELDALAEKLDKPLEQVKQWFNSQRKMQHHLERKLEEKLSDGELREESGTSVSRKSEPKPKLRARYRKFGDSEKSALRNAYIENPYPSQCELNALADELDLPRDNVKFWFCNERARQRRLKSEHEEPSDNEAQGESGTPGFRKRERGPELRAPNRFTDSERSALRNLYMESPYPSRCELSTLAEKLGKPRDQVKSWFYKERARQRLLKSEHEEPSDDEARGEGGTPRFRKRERGPELCAPNKFTDSERSALRNLYMENPYPSRCELNALAREFDKPLKEVCVWFGCQHQKQRRLERKQEEQSDDEPQEKGGTPHSRKRERGPKLRDLNRFTDSEWSALRNAYMENPYPPRRQLNALAREFDKPLKKVCRWFALQRKEQRRLERKQEEQSDDELQEEGGTPHSQERARKPKLRPTRVLTDREQSTLRNAFIEKPYPSRRELNALAEELDKPLDKMKAWFASQRHLEIKQVEALTDREQSTLRNAFIENPCPSGPELNALADELDVPLKRVINWFTIQRRTDSEQSTLRKAFNENPFPSRHKLNALAEELRKSVKHLKTWFKSQREEQRRLRCDHPSAGDGKREGEQEEQSDDQPQDESGTPSSRKRERESNPLRNRSDCIFTGSELATLKNAFLENPYPSWQKVNVLGDELGKPVDEVKAWFSNRRALCFYAGDSKPAETEQNRRHENQVGGEVQEEPTSALDSSMTPGVPASTAAGSSFIKKLGNEQHEKAPPLLTLTSATLAIGSHLCTGSEEDRPGNGLEIKFLFESRRIVYEIRMRDWVKEVYRQGWPSYRVEVPFDKIETIIFDQDGASEIRIVPKSLPEFFVQHESNFRERVKERSYVRTEDKRLAEIFRESSEHIRFREPTKSLLLRSTLMQLEPKFQRTLARGSGPETEQPTQEREQEFETPTYSVAQESARLAASKDTPTQLNEGAGVPGLLPAKAEVDTRGSGLETEQPTQERELECETPTYSVAQESARLAASKDTPTQLNEGVGVPGLSPAKAEVDRVPPIPIPDGFQLFGIGSAVFTSHDMAREHRLSSLYLYWTLS